MIESNFIYYASHNSDLVTRYNGKCIVYVNGGVIGVYPEQSFICPKPNPVIKYIPKTL